MKNVTSWSVFQNLVTIIITRDFNTACLPVAWPCISKLAGIVSYTIGITVYMSTSTKLRKHLNVIGLYSLHQTNHLGGKISCDSCNNMRTK